MATMALIERAGAAAAVRRGLVGFAAAAALAAAAPAAAQEFEIPDGFEKVFEPEARDGADWRYLYSVRPDDGPFAHLSAIHLREVTAAVDDPAAWLENRLTAGFALAEPSGEDEGLFTSPDSPFADPAFDELRRALPRLREGIERLGRIALDFCEGPTTGYNASGDFRELYCVFGMGPVRQYLVLRLQRVGERWYYTEIRTMNERRLRHLIAIANSFVAGA